MFCHEVRFRSENAQDFSTPATPIFAAEIAARRESSGDVSTLITSYRSSKT